jgi:hypothetical protein
MSEVAMQRQAAVGLIFKLGLGLAVGFVLLLNAVPVASDDLWWQIKVGQLTLENGAIPRTLLFPFTEARNLSFTAHEWLPSILFFEWVRAFDESGLTLMQALFALLQAALCFMLARLLSRSNGVALLATGLAMLAVNYRYVLRPELFALVFFVLTLIVLSRYRLFQRPGVLFWTIPIGLLWANCHGSFLLGPAVAAVFAAGESAQAALRPDAGASRGRLRQAAWAGLPYAAVAAGMLLASLVNPRGLELLRFAFQVQASEAMKSFIKEWLPTFHPLFMMEPGFWIFAAVGLLSLGLIVANWRAVTLTDILLFVPFACLASQRNRHIVWFVFVALTVCSVLIGRRALTAKREAHIQVAGGVLALIGVVVVLTFGNTRGAFIYEAPSNNFSAPMAKELSDPGLSGNVFNSYELGSELIYRDWPRLRPSIDSRIDSYGDADFLRQQHMLNDPALLGPFLSSYGVNHMLLLRRDFYGHVSLMPQIRRDWHIRFADFKMVLLERNVAVPLAPLATAPGD